MKRFSKAYKQNIKETRKALKEIAKTWQPYDYGWIEQSVFTQLKAMHKYYCEGENVWGMDETGDTTRADMIKELIVLMDKYKIIDNMETCKQFWNKLGEYILYLWD